MDFEEVVWIGKNQYLYTFGVARIAGEWHGFARGEIPNDPKNGGKDSAMIFFFPPCESADKLTAIKQTVAYAKMPENGYGGVEQWAPEFIANVEVQTVTAESFVCPNCDEYFCFGECENYGFEIYDY